MELILLRPPTGENTPGLNSFMNKEKFIAGVPFSYSLNPDKDDIYSYDGLSLKIRSGDWFDYYCNINGVNDFGVKVSIVAFGISFELFIQFQHCKDATELLKTKN